MSRAERHLDIRCAPRPTAPPEFRYPDVETASDGYARRFTGAAGKFFLDVQARALERLMTGLEQTTVLEVGGGHGQLVPTFLQRRCQLTLVGSRERAHERVRAGFPTADIRYVTTDLLELPWPDRSFEVVAAVRLLSHVDDWETLLAEFCRVADRSVIIDFPSWRSVNALAPLLFRLKKSAEKDTRPYRSFLPSRISAELRRHGFGISGSHGQFVLPMLLHRAMSGARWLQDCEQAAEYLRLTRLLGSPVLLRADRHRH